MTRKDDLEAAIRQSYQLLQEYEEIVRLSDQMNPPQAAALQGVR